MNSHKLLTKSELIFRWRWYEKHCSPHPCRMPTPQEEAGRLIAIYGNAALKQALYQTKHSPWLEKVVYYLEHAK